HRIVGNRGRKLRARHLNVWKVHCSREGDRISQWLERRSRCERFTVLNDHPVEGALLPEVRVLGACLKGQVPRSANAWHRRITARCYKKSRKEQCRARQPLHSSSCGDRHRSSTERDPQTQLTAVESGRPLCKNGATISRLSSRQRHALMHEPAKGRPHR